MHRKHIRATDAGTGTDVDVPTAIWADGQFLIYLGGELFTQFVVQSHNTSTDNAVARWDGTTGHLIQDSTVIIDDAGAVTGVTTMNGIPPGDWVRGPAAGGSTDNAITRWDGTTGRLVQNSVVIINDTGDITGVTSINTIPVGDFVRGPTPATATDNALARWDATTGRLIQNSLIIVGDTGNASGFLNISTSTINSRDPNKWVDGPTPALATNNHIALWDTGSGRLIKDSLVNVDPTTGDISTPGDMTPSKVGGIPVGLLVKSSGGTPHPDQAVARWRSGAGNPIDDSTVFLDDSGAMTGMTTINGILVDQIVTNLSGVGAAGNLPRFSDWFDIEDSGISAFSLTPFDWVKGPAPAAATDNAVVRWDNSGIDGRLVQDSLVVVDDAGNVTGMGTLNTRTIANWVDGPASAVNQNVAVFSGTTGKLISDSGLRLIDAVRMATGSTDNAVVRWDGTTGSPVQNSVVIIDDSGNITGAGTLNTRTIARWVDGPASGGSTDNTLAVWDGTSGRLLKNGSSTGIAVDPSTSVITTPVGVLVHSGATHADNAVVRWDGTGAHTQDSTVIVDDSGNITGVLSINGNTAVTDQHIGNAASNATVTTSLTIGSYTPITAGDWVFTLWTPVSGITASGTIGVTCNWGSGTGSAGFSVGSGGGATQTSGTNMSVNKTALTTGGGLLIVTVSVVGMTAGTGITVDATNTGTAYHAYPGTQMTCKDH